MRRASGFLYSLLIACTFASIANADSDRDYARKMMGVRKPRGVPVTLPAVERAWKPAAVTSFSFTVEGELEGEALNRTNHILGGLFAVALPRHAIPLLEKKDGTLQGHFTSEDPDEGAVGILALRFFSLYVPGGIAITLPNGTQVSLKQGEFSGDDGGFATCHLATTATKNMQLLDLTAGPCWKDGLDMKQLKDVMIENLSEASRRGLFATAPVIGVDVHGVFDVSVVFDDDSGASAVVVDALRSTLCWGAKRSECLAGSVRGRPMPTITRSEHAVMLEGRPETSAQPENPAEWLGLQVALAQAGGRRNAPRPWPGKVAAYPRLARLLGTEEVRWVTTRTPERGLRLDTSGGLHATSGQAEFSHDGTLSFVAVTGLLRNERTGQERKLAPSDGLPRVIGFLPGAVVLWLQGKGGDGRWSNRIAVEGLEGQRRLFEFPPPAMAYMTGPRIQADHTTVFVTEDGFLFLAIDGKTEGRSIHAWDKKLKVQGAMPWGARGMVVQLQIAEASSQVNGASSYGVLEGDKWREIHAELPAGGSRPLAVVGDELWLMTSSGAGTLSLKSGRWSSGLARFGLPPDAEPTWAHDDGSHLLVATKKDGLWLVGKKTIQVAGVAPPSPLDVAVSPSGAVALVTFDGDSQRLLLVRGEQREELELPLGGGQPQWSIRSR